MKVFVGDLKVGMRLLEDVNGANGRFLLAADTVLEEKHLRIFNIWGVSEVEVLSGSKTGEDNDEPDPRLLAIADEYVEGVFAYANMSVAPMKVLKEACIKHFVGELEKDKALPEVLMPIGGDLDILDAPLFESAGVFLNSGIRLAAFPDIYYKIMETLNDPGAGSENLADIISKDSGLSAKLISLVNSPLYGFDLPVESLSRAVSLVGTDGVCQLALSVSVMEAFKGEHNVGFSMADFWKHSLACAVFCRILAQQVPGISQDKCFVVGMLHDIGQLIMLQQYSEKIDLAFQLRMSRSISYCKAESMIFGFDHCELAGKLFELWNIPPSITAGVVGHHGVRSGELCIESAICSVADAMAVALQYGTDSFGLINTPYTGAWDTLGLPDGAVVTTISKAKRQIADILAIFGG
ncbi:HDOD domain-containing protein [Maridesulfovibrio salexigens]|uniref:Putative signal transduction protein n=1 Tax=Maridesulfovibrio salexigens (strain ATCC 14822 / DSM 2638 / NCIMB 8403 / VKM B-1763) TaxID=526222 RepID=C6BXK5_MARSD|nr:HDOD domain-containing protein [Maridesulfovibrio salexigens]ACS78563.1 putative signal transduction protein [Maridesulfovibrio salexigens DSM 2638]